MLQMVVFDFDGVIADTEPVHFELTCEALADEGIDLSWQQYCEKYLAYDDRELFTHVLVDNRRQAEKKKISELMERKRGNFARHIKDNCVIFPGVNELLAALKEGGISCSLCSGSFVSEIELVLRSSGLRDYFGIIVGADDVSASKPDPEGYRLIVSKANEQFENSAKIAPEQCVAIEDSIGGIKAAKGAGLKCLAVTNSYAVEELGQADNVVETLRKVDVGYLKEMVKITKPE